MLIDTTPYLVTVLHVEGLDYRSSSVPQRGYDEPLTQPLPCIILCTHIRLFIHIGAVSTFENSGDLLLSTRLIETVHEALQHALDGGSVCMVLLSHDWQDRQQQ